MTAYRTSEEPADRIATIDIARPQTWWAGVAFGTMFGLVGLGMMFSAQNWSRFTCARDDTGKGLCVYVEHHPFGEHATRWDVASLRKARVDADRFVLVFEGGERRLFDEDTRKVQEARAHRLEEFIASPSERTLHLEDDDGASQFLAAFLALFGVAILSGTNAKYPGRRLVLDEAAGTARFEHRAWMRWTEDATMQLGEVAAIEKKIASYEPERDDALAELKAFLR